MEGEKAKPLIIGKPKNPRCFKNYDISRFNYINNKNAWMTSFVFKNMLFRWDSKLRSEGRKILLLLDNCSSHPDINTELTHIKLVFIPPNCTSVLQPMDAGVIRTFKHHYKRKLVSKLIHFYDVHDEGKLKITLLDALNFSYDAWELVTKESIINCFRHAGVSGEIEKYESTGPCLEKVDIIAKSYFGEDFSFEDYLKFDECLPTDAHENETQQNSYESSSDELMASPIIGIGTALNNFQKVATFYRDTPCEQNIKECLALVEDDLEKRYMKSKTKQLLITEFINKKS